MEKNKKLWTEMRFVFCFLFVFSSHDVLGKSISKLSDINLNTRTRALLLNIPISFFSYPNWLVQNHCNEDTWSLPPCVSLTSLKIAPVKLAKE